jgi:CheY-like chemotaxis protein
MSDAGRLRQILINLLGNAVKFTESGEVSLSIESAREAGEDYVHFAVRDTGIGIPASMQGRIFDAFTQVDGSSTRRFGGTGLGLTITSQLVKLMGGAIWLESEEGRGSTFHFHLPLPPVSGIESPGQNLEISLDGLSVLVVDDNATNRRILQEMLVHWGCKAVVVDGGEEALLQLRGAQDRNEPFGLILTDAQMPVMDGFMFIEEVRSSISHQQPAIMMLTSIDHGEAIQKCQDLGISAYLTKPVRRADLYRAIAEVMGKSMQAQHTAGSAQSETLRNELLHILIVDDNPVNRKLAARLIEKRGFQVSTACNGKQAIQLTGETLFDLVFMDVQMPEMDGFEATQAIRERELSSAQHLPIVAMTAHAMAGDRELCLDAGMDDYVTKPLRAADLDNVLRKFLLKNTEQEFSPAVQTVEGWSRS